MEMDGLQDGTVDEAEELEEISAVAGIGGSLEGFSEPLGKEEEEKEVVVERVLNYLLQYKGLQYG
jgi:hypothetical protein